MAEIAQANAFAVALLGAVGLSDLKRVTKLSIVVEPGIPKVLVEFCLPQEAGEAAINVINEYGLSAGLIRSAEVGSSEKSVSLLTLVETIHRPLDSHAPHCKSAPETRSSIPTKSPPDPEP